MLYHLIQLYRDAIVGAPSIICYTIYMKKMLKTSTTHIDGPLLDKVKINFDHTVNFSAYPFSLNIIKNLKSIEFTSQVTFFVGENGAGKSTILEAIAHHAGFGIQVEVRTSTLGHLKKKYILVYNH